MSESRHDNHAVGTGFLAGVPRWKSISEFEEAANCFEKTFQNGLLDFSLSVKRLMSVLR